MNNFDKSIEYNKEEISSEQEITFLDMTIFINKLGGLEFKKYRKNSVNTVISNFEHSVASKNTLWEWASISQLHVYFF